MSASVHKRIHTTKLQHNENNLVTTHKVKYVLSENVKWFVKYNAITICDISIEINLAFAIHEHFYPNLSHIHTHHFKTGST